MPDYNKIPIRMSNTGLNVEYTPEALEFGQWQVLKNVYTQYEGEVTGRRGIAITSSNGGAGSAILGIQQLNDWINNYFTYFVKLANGKWYWTVDGSNHALTADPFKLIDTTCPAGASTFGSFIIDRPPLSAGAWAYVGDRNFNVKFGLTSSGTLQVKNMGCTRPLSGTAPALTATAGGSLTANTTYYYRYTLYDKNTGVESLYNYTDNTTGVATTGVNLTVSVVIPTESVDTAVTHIRLYRSGGSLATWNRVSDDSGTYAYTGTTITVSDALSDTAIASATILDTLSDKPFTITKPDGTILAGQPMPYMFGPYLGYVLGVGDPYNPGYLYWTNKFEPDMQNPANNIEVSSPQDPLQNGFIYDGKPYIFSKEALYAVYAGLSAESAFTPSKTSCGRGLWTPHAFCVGPQVFFLSKDGIYATSGGLEQALTDNELRPLFDPKQTATTIDGIGVVDYTQVNYMFMVYYKNEVFFQYYGKDGNTNFLIYDVRYRRWRHMLGAGQGASIRSLYTDTQAVANLVLGGNDGNLYKESGTSDGGASIVSELKTGLITMGVPLMHKEFGALVVDLNPNSATVTINCYTNKGATLIDNGSGYTARTSASSRTRLFINLNSTFAEDLTIDFSWTTASTQPIIYSYELFYRPDVPQMNSWSVTGVTHGILGWQIVRSAYITVIADGTLTLTITSVLDGSTISYTYTIASPAGVKRKIFIPFDPIKGKLFNYQLSLNGATYFRFYPEESEIHVKPWISSFGYATVNPFHSGIEAPANFGGQGGSGSTREAALGGGGGNSGADLAGSLIPQFSFSGLGGGTPLGPVDTTTKTPAHFPNSNAPPTGDDHGSQSGSGPGSGVGGGRMNLPD